MKTVWIDLETTGLDAKSARIIEFAALYEDRGEIIEERHIYCKPFDKQPEDFARIEELTGISWAELEVNGVSDEELYRAVVAFMDSIVNKYDRGDKAIFAGYNATFDERFVRELFNRNGNQYYGSYFYSGRLDVMSSVVEAVWEGRLDRPANLKLATVAVALEFGEFQAHSALEDIRMTRAIQMMLSHSGDMRLQQLEHEEVGG